MSLQLTTADIGKQFRTRFGRLITVTGLTPHDDTYYVSHPFEGQDDTGRRFTFSTCGAWREDYTKCKDDLVERLVVVNGIPVPASTHPAGLQNVLRTLPARADDRKAAPVMTGALDYFPLALAEIARISKAGNDQHNPGQPLHWARGKSADHADCVARHMIERGTVDTDGQRHTAKAAWRVLALLQEELELEAGWTPAADFQPAKSVPLVNQK